MSKKTSGTGGTPNQELRALMEKHKLGRRDVARLAERNIASSGQCYSVNNWLSDPASTAYRRMPEGVLTLIKLKLKAMTAAQKARLEGPADREAILEYARSCRGGLQ